VPGRLAGRCRAASWHDAGSTHRNGNDERRVLARVMRCSRSISRMTQRDHRRERPEPGFEPFSENFQSQIRTSKPADDTVCPKRRGRWEAVKTQDHRDCRSSLPAGSVAWPGRPAKSRMESFISSGAKGTSFARGVIRTTERMPFSFIPLGTSAGGTPVEVTPTPTSPNSVAFSATI